VRGRGTRTEPRWTFGELLDLIRADSPDGIVAPLLDSWRRRPDRPSNLTVERVAGGWTALCRAAGLVTRRQRIEGHARAKAEAAQARQPPTRVEEPRREPKLPHESPAARRRREEREAREAELAAQISEGLVCRQMTAEDRARFEQACRRRRFDPERQP
jgi:hypothetical protein